MANAAAVRTVESLLPKREPLPEESWEYVELKQLRTLARASYDAAKFAEYQANLSKLRAMALLAELNSRVELMEQRLGIEPKEGDNEL